MANSYLENRLNTSLTTARQAFLDRTNQQSTGVKTFGANVYPGKNVVYPQNAPTIVSSRVRDVVGVHSDKPSKKSGFVRDQLRKTAMLLSPAAVEERLKRSVPNSPSADLRIPKGRLGAVKGEGKAKVRRSISAAADIPPDLLIRKDYRNQTRFGSIRKDSFDETSTPKSARNLFNDSFGSGFSLNMPKSDSGTLV